MWARERPLIFGWGAAFVVSDMENVDMTHGQAQDKATLVAEDVTRWNGDNNVSRATGSHWVREDLWRTTGGAWVIWRDNRDGRGGAIVGVSWHGITPVEAEDWLRKQDMHDLADEHFAAVEERLPGRPSVGGGLVSLALGADLLARVDAAVERAGATRANWVRKALESVLTAETLVEIGTL